MVMEVTQERVITKDSPVSEFPTDVKTLVKMLQTLLDDVDSKNQRLQDLESQLAWFRRHTFGRRSEKYPTDHPVLFDLLEQVSQIASSPKAAAPEVAKPNRRNGRAALPAHLPREPMEHPVAAEQLTCSHCGQAKERIGQEVTEELDYVPSSFVVREHIRPKYACKQCQDGVVIADLPDRPIDKGRAGTGLLSHVLVSKYADHLPLHRQEGIYQRHGLDLKRSTLCDWVAQSAALLQPIVKALHQRVLQSPKIHTDDTSVPVRNGPRKQIRRGYLWVYLDHHGHVVFDYTATRSREGPKQFLGRYAGYLQADAYPGYDAVFALGHTKEVACWAHARRYFFEAKDSDPLRAHQVLLWIKDLYAIESHLQSQDLEIPTIASYRQTHSRPILDTIKAHLDQWSREVLPKSPIAEATTYARNQWDALNRYLEDGILAIDNNLAERTLRTVAIGRKNWLFAGSDKGGERAAIIYSLIASCKQCGVEPFAYLRDVLNRVSSHPASRVEELFPCNWKPLEA